LQTDGDISGRFSPIDVSCRRGIEAIVVGLGVVRPIALINSALNNRTGSSRQTAGATGETNLQVSIGIGFCRTHRDKSTGNISSADRSIITGVILGR